MLTLLKFSDYPLYWYLKNYYAEDRIMPIEFIILFFVYYTIFGFCLSVKMIKPTMYKNDALYKLIRYIFICMNIIIFAFALMHLIHFHFFYN